MNQQKYQFPIKLYAMLELAGDTSDAVTWLPHGRAFRIIDQDKFMHLVPLFFNQTKIRSFHRQLNMWGFRRMSSDPNGWYHKCFLRGLPEEIQNMVRIKVKSKSKASHPSDGEIEPDFYCMPPLPMKNSPSLGRASPRHCADVSLSLSESSHQSECDAAQNPIPHELCIPTARHVTLEYSDSTVQTIGSAMPALIHTTTTNEDERMPWMSQTESKRFFHESVEYAPFPVPDKIVTSEEPLSFEDDVSDDEFMRCIDEVLDILE